VSGSDDGGQKLTGVAAAVHDVIVHREPVHRDDVLEEIPTYTRDEMSRALESLKGDGLVKEVEKPVEGLDGATRTLLATDGYEVEADDETAEDRDAAGETAEQSDDELVHNADLSDQSLAVVRRTLRDQQHKSATTEEWEALEAALDELPEVTTESAEEFAKGVLP